ncbi:hypothetical protein P7C73_g5629, partial [Tremellales sp. Uapishka_1]
MQYYAPSQGGYANMDPRMQMQQMGGAMQPGMPGGMGMQGMGMQGMGGLGGMQGMGGIGMNQGYGQAYMPQRLGYEYTLPVGAYKPEPTWGAWDLAHAQYSGSRMDRGFFDNIIGTLSNFFTARHLSEEAARDAHRRVYFNGGGEDAGNKTLGGAAAFQAYLIWDRDHYSQFHAFPSNENRERLVGLAVAELFSLWDKVSPRSSRAKAEEAAEYAAATGKYLYDRHYDLQSRDHGHHHHAQSYRRSGYGADDDSDSESERRRERRRSYPQMGYSQGGMGMGMGQGGMGMGMGPHM